MNVPDGLVIAVVCLLLKEGISFAIYAHKKLTKLDRLEEKVNALEASRPKRIK